MLDHDVRALAQQNLGRIGFLAWVKPGVHPNDLYFEIRIDRLRAQHEGVDAGDNFRNGEGNDVARRSGLRHLGGNLADDVAAFVEFGVVGRHVGRRLVAGCVLKLHIRKFRRNLQGGLHEAE